MPDPKTEANATRLCMSCGHMYGNHDEHLECCVQGCTCVLFDVAPYHPEYNPDPERRFIEELVAEREGWRARAELAEQTIASACDGALTSGDVAILVSNVDSMGALLGADTPWPTTDVLAKLADAGDHLLHAHDCDTHGWEEIGRAVTVARERLAAYAAKARRAG